MFRTCILASIARRVPSNAVFCLVETVVEKASGMTFDDYVDATARPATAPGFSPAKRVYDVFRRVP